uniref:Uncharacterized protein n=1 Tax=Solanum tuberosum TaxID=4113 RepID=M1DAF7_SOLTU
MPTEGTYKPTGALNTGTMRVVAVGQGLLVLGTPLYGPLHGPCEGPQTVKAIVVLHLGLGSTCSASRISPQPVIKTTARGGLHGLMPEPWVILPHLYEPSYGLCGVPRLVNSSVVHHYWVGVSHEQVDGP